MLEDTDCCHYRHDPCGCRTPEIGCCVTRTDRPSIPPISKDAPRCKSRLLFGEEIRCICTSCSEELSKH